MYLEADDEIIPDSVVNEEVLVGKREYIIHRHPHLVARDAQHFVNSMQFCSIGADHKLCKMRQKPLRTTNW